MTAEELFDELGCRREFEENEYIRYRKGESWDIEIFFDLNRKTYNTSEYITFMEVDMKFHIAIHQQLIELGWINEHEKI